MLPTTKLQRRLVRAHGDIDPADKYLMSCCSGGGDTTTVTKADPWEPSQPYLIKGMEDLDKLYSANPNGIAPYSGEQLAQLPEWMSNSITGAAQNTAGLGDDAQMAMFNSLQGALNPEQVRALMINPTNVTGQKANAAGMRNATISGNGIDYSTAVNDALYGGVDNPWLQQQARGMVDMTNQTFGGMSRDMLEQLQTQIIPGIEDNFQTAGALGSSRQALMEGQAVGRTNTELAREAGDLSQNLSGQLANLYGGAYESAENRAASLSAQLAQQSSAERMAQASLQQEASLANARLQQEASLANAQMAQQASLSNQLMQMEAARANQTAGLDAEKLDSQNTLMQTNAASMLPNVAGLQTTLNNQALQGYLPLLSEQQGNMDIAKNQYYAQQLAPWEQLQRYAGMMNPLGGQGGTSTAGTDAAGNPLAGAMGGYAMGAAGANALGAASTSFAAGPLMAAMPWLGLLGGIAGMR